MRSYLPAPLRTLTTAVAALAATCLIAAPQAAPAQASSCVGATAIPTAATMDAAKAATLCLLNVQRAANGLKPLTENAGLEQVSDTYSRNMVATHVFDHVLADGIDLTARLTGYTGPADAWTIGENIGYGESIQATPLAMVIAWMNSAGHRANILNGDFTDVGIGIVNGTPVGSGPNSATYTTDFGDRTMPEAAAPAAPRYVTPKRCTKAAIAKLSKSGRKTRTASCARLRRAAVRAARAAR